MTLEAGRLHVSVQRWAQEYIAPPLEPIAHRWAFQADYDAYAIRRAPEPMLLEDAVAWLAREHWDGGGNLWHLAINEEVAMWEAKPYGLPVRPMTLPVLGAYFRHITPHADSFVAMAETEALSLPPHMLEGAHISPGGTVYVRDRVANVRVYLQRARLPLMQPGMLLFLPVYPHARGYTVVAGRIGRLIETSVVRSMPESVVPYLPLYGP